MVRLGEVLTVSGEPAMGQRVVVPWGVDGLIGVVKRVYGRPGRRRALVTVPIQAASGKTLEETTLSVPLRALDDARLL